MRLTKQEHKGIKNAVMELDPKAKVFLYGSRANPDLKGGDIDLLVISEKLDFPDKVSLLARIKEQLGDQRIDLSIRNNATLVSDPFVLSILPEAKEL